MSLSRTLRVTLFGALALGATVALGACSFQPVYSGNLTAQPTLALSYAKPNSRLEQIVYQELGLRLGSTDNATAPLAAVSVSVAYSDTMLSQTDNPSEPREVSVTATLTVTSRDGTPTPTKAYTRTATANFTRNDQVLADRSAEIEAAERAAKAAAESLRLAVLASLSR